MFTYRHVSCVYQQNKSLSQKICLNLSNSHAYNVGYQSQETPCTMFFKAHPASSVPKSYLPLLILSVDGPFFYNDLYTSF